MSTPDDLREGDVVRIRFDAIAPRGDAVAHPSEAPDSPPLSVYASGVIPGETARVRIRRVRRTWIAVDVEAIEQPSPHRVEPKCPLFSICSGCQLQHVAYPHQLELKTEIVRTQLRRFGGFDDPPVAPCIGADDPWHYRNHARFTIRDGHLGYIRRFRRQWFPVAHCFIMEPRINAILERLQGRLQGVTQCNVRVGYGPTDVMIQPRLALDDIESGQARIYESLHGRRFRVSSAAFFQVNRAQAEKLVELVADRCDAGPRGTVVDAYAGVGTFAVMLSPRVGKVIAIEESGPAVADARENVAGLPNVELHLGKAELLLDALEPGVDAVILDPPRSGCLPGALAAVTRLRPRRVVYVSCDASSLGRDLQLLCGPQGAFDLLEVQPLDMFPHTHHVECVATLTARPT